jgi:hypothetical protein
LLGLHFDPENGRDMFFRNVGWFSTVYAQKMAPFNVKIYFREIGYEWINWTMETVGGTW